MFHPAAFRAVLMGRLPFSALTMLKAKRRMSAMLMAA